MSESTLIPEVFFGMQLSNSTIIEEVQKATQTYIGAVQNAFENFLTGIETADELTKFNVAKRLRRYTGFDFEIVRDNLDLLINKELLTGWICLGEDSLLGFFVNGNEECSFGIEESSADKMISFDEGVEVTVVNPKNMRVKDYEKLDLPVSWCIYKEGQNNDDLGEYELDLSAPDGVSDGVYYAESSGYGRRGKGVTIKDGYYVPEPTAQIAYLVAGDADHRFLEALDWNGDHFEVQLGS